MKVRSIFATMLALLATMIATPAFATGGSVSGSINTPSGVTLDLNNSQTTWRPGIDGLIELALPGFDVAKQYRWTVTVESTTYTSDSGANAWFQDCSIPNDGTPCLWIETTSLGDLTGSPVTVSGSVSYRSTFVYSDVVADFAAIGLTVLQSDLENMPQYDQAADQTTYYFTLSNSTSENISFLVDQFSVDGNAVTPTSTATTIYAGSANEWFAAGVESGDKYWGLDNAPLAITLTQLVNSTTSSSGLVAPSGVTVSAHNPQYWDYDSLNNRTCLTLKVSNSTTAPITLNPRSMTYSVSGSSATASTSDYIYLPARGNAYLWLETCLTGDLRFGDTITVGGSLVKVTGPKLVNKMKLPSGYTASMTVNDIYYNSETRKSYVTVTLTARGNLSNVALRFEGMKLNGKKLSGEIVRAAYESESGGYSFGISFDPVAGDQRLGKTFTVEGKVTKETKTRVIDSLVTTGVSDGTGVNMMGLDWAANWAYDAKKDLTSITMDASNWSSTTKTFNFSAVVVKVKVKDKKGKWTSVKSYKSLVGRVSIPRQDGKSIVVAKIPGDLRSNWQPVTLDGSITSN